MKYVMAILMLLILVVGCAPSGKAVTSQPQSSPPGAKFAVAELRVIPQMVFVGDNATVFATVKNVGAADGTYQAALLLDGKKYSEQEIAILRGQSKELHFPISSVSAGTKTISIDDVKTDVSFYNAQPYTIQYDDYELQRYTPSVAIGAFEPYGQMVRFTAVAKPFRINSISMAAQASILSKYRFFTIYIWDCNRKILWAKDFPWTIFPSGYGITWRDLAVPNVLVSDDFYVELISHTLDTGKAMSVMYKEEYLFLGFNKSDYETRSSWSYKGLQQRHPSEAMRKINFCIRVQGEGSPMHVLFYDDAVADTYAVASNDGGAVFSPAVSFIAPIYPFNLRLIQLYGYRDIMDTREQFITVKVIDQTFGKIIWQKNIPLSDVSYSMERTGDWLNIETGGVVCNGDFFVEVVANESVNVWLGCDTTTKNNNSEMMIDDRVEKWRDWTTMIDSEVNTYSRDNTKWMIRVVGEDSK